MSPRTVKSSCRWSDNRGRKQRSWNVTATFDSKGNIKAKAEVRNEDEVAGETPAVKGFSRQTHLPQRFTGHKNVQHVKFAL